MLAADELGPSWVRVNGIRPGLVRTELVEPVLSSPEIREDYRQCTPLPRFGETEDIANLAVFSQRRGRLDHGSADKCRRWTLPAPRPGLLGNAGAGVRFGWVARRRRKRLSPSCFQGPRVFGPDRIRGTAVFGSPFQFTQGMPPASIGAPSVRVSALSMSCHRTTPTSRSPKPQ